MNKRLILALLGTSPFWLSLVFLIFGPSLTFSLASVSEMLTDWDKANLTEALIPETVKAKTNEIQFKEKTIKIKDIEVFYREPFLENGPTTTKISVLLLHGKMFSSKTWLDLGTLNLIASMGYRTIAVDIPGYGNSPKATIGDEFVHDLVNELKLEKPVVISPSLSGYYTLPYLVKYWSEMGGFLPVAPQGWETLEAEKPSPEKKNIERVPNDLKEFLPENIPDLSHIKVPTLVVYGEKDRRRNSALCSLLPWSIAHEIPNGSHPAYLDNPELWHQLIYNFLKLASK